MFTTSLFMFSMIFSELKDNLGGAPVDGEMSELLRAVLANDPDVFSGGSDGQFGV